MATQDQGDQEDLWDWLETVAGLALLEERVSQVIQGTRESQGLWVLAENQVKMVEMVLERLVPKEKKVTQDSLDIRVQRERLAILDPEGDLARKETGAKGEMQGTLVNLDKKERVDSQDHTARKDQEGQVLCNVTLSGTLKKIALAAMVHRSALCTQPSWHSPSIIPKVLLGRCSTV